MKNKILLHFLLGYGFCTYGQVGIGTESPNPSSQLEIVSTDKGVLIPQIALKSTTDATTISNGNVESLLVYNTTTSGSDLQPGYYFWRKNKWCRIITEGEAQGKAKMITNADGTYTYIGEDGGHVVIDIPAKETKTTLVYDALAGTLTYTGESGTTQMVDMKKLVKDNETVTSFVDKGNGVFSYTNETGIATDFNITGATGPQGPAGATGAQGPTGLPVNVNTAAPITGGGLLDKNLNLAIAQATATTDGFLSAADWSAFNAKSSLPGGGDYTHYLRGDNTWQFLNAAAVQLGNVNNTSDADKPVSTATQTALDLKANIASPIFTGTPTAPTAVPTDNSTAIATTAFVKTAAAASVADAIVNDITTVAPSQNVVFDALASKADKTNGASQITDATAYTNLGTTVDATQATINSAINTKMAPLASPALTGTPTAPTALAADNSTAIATTAFVKTTAAASVADAIVNDVTTVAPSQNAVFDALASKADKTNGASQITDATAYTNLGTAVDATQATINSAINTKMAPLASPALTGTPTAPTALATDNSTAIATTAFVKTTAAASVADAIVNDVTTVAPSQNAVFDALAVKAPLESPSLTGTPTAPTAVPTDNSTAIATTAFVKTAAAASVADAIVNDVTTVAPSQNAVFDALAVKAPLESPSLTGTPTAPTAVPTDNSTAIATTAFVKTAAAATVSDGIVNDVTTVAPSQNAVFDALEVKAPLESPALTGTPTAPTAVPTDNSTTIATTAFVKTVATASVADAIVNDVTTVAPSQNAVFDALALKEDLANKTSTVTGNESSVDLYPSISGVTNWVKNNLTTAGALPAKTTNVVTADNILITDSADSHKTKVASVSKLNGSFVDLSSAQTITGVKTFARGVFTGDFYAPGLVANNTVVPNQSAIAVILSGAPVNGTGVQINNNTTTNGYKAFTITNAATTTAIPFSYIKAGSPAVVKAQIDDAGNMTAQSFIKSGGTNQQILMADGSVTPLSTVTGKEDKVNKQNNLTVDGTGIKYPTVDAVNAANLLKAPLASPALTGTPTAPTATAGANTTQIATTAFVTNAVAGATTPDATNLVKGKVRLATLAETQTGTDNTTAVTPADLKPLLDAKAADNMVVHLAGNETITGNKDFTGTLTAPTATLGTNSTQVATTAFVKTAAAASVADAIVNDVTTVAPSQNAVFDALASKADKTNGVSQITDATAYTNLGTTVDATQATINSAINTKMAPLVSPALTGTPTAPTAVPTDNSTAIATTAFVKSAAAASVADAIVNDITTVAPSQNAVFDALASKADKTNGASQITDATAYTNLGTAVDATQATINSAINTKLGTAVNAADNGLTVTANTVHLGGALTQPTTITTSGTNTLTIAGSGNVGVGTSNPTFTTPANTGAAIPTVGVDGTVNATNYTTSVQVVTAGAWDMSKGSVAKWIMAAGANVLTITNMKAGMYGSIICTNAGTSTLTFGAGTHKVINGLGGIPILTARASAVDILSFLYDGTTFWWTVGNDYN